MSGITESAEGLVCPSCGARERVQHEGQTRCSFCGQLLLARLLPGTLCADGECRLIAAALCRGCARALCERHAAPGRAYWNAAWQWNRLFPHWTSTEGVAWARLVRPLPRLPVPGFNPFPWCEYDRPCRIESGALEEELLDAARHIAAQSGCEAGETGAGFEELCGPCEARLVARFDALAQAHAARYRQRAFVDRLDALEAELRQAQRYVETFLQRSLEPAAAVPSEPVAELPTEELSMTAPPEQWERVGHELLHRLELVTLLAGRLEAPK